MNKTELFKAFGMIDDDILERSEETSKTERKIRWHYALIVAILSVCLMGAGVVAVIWGDSIQNMFSYYWQAITGKEMSAGQTAVIDHLSQKIDLSQTIGDVTVTVDSATIGDDSFYLLFRIEGMTFAGNKSYGFDETNIRITPDPTEEHGGMTSYGYTSHGIDGDGAVILLMEYAYVTKNGMIETDDPLNVEIRMNNLLEFPQTEREKILQEGEWSFNFTIDYKEAFEIIRLPDATVKAIDLTKRDEYTPVDVLLTDIEVTNTGIRFKYDFKKGSYDIPAHIDAVLENDVCIGVGGGSGHPLEESGLLLCSYQWLVPIPLDELTAINFNGVIIPIS